MSKRRPKTTGLEWLYLSLASFNGSGYADKATPEQYIASYRAFKRWKKDTYALRLLDDYPEFAYDQACRLVLARDAGHTPSTKNYAKFKTYYDSNTLELL